VIWEGVGLGGKKLEEGEKLHLEAISEGGVPVKRRGSGVQGGMVVVYIGGKAGGVPWWSGCSVGIWMLGSGVEEVGKDLSGEVREFEEFGGQELTDKGRVADGLAKDPSAYKNGVRTIPGLVEAG
jgi:hypothetical protein